MVAHYAKPAIPLHHLDMSLLLHTTAFVLHHSTSRGQILAEPEDLRLGNAVTSDSGNAQYGRLQAFYNGGWGTVSNPRPQYLDVPNADEGDQEVERPRVNVACRWLGFSSGIQTALLGSSLLTWSVCSE